MDLNKFNNLDIILVCGLPGSGKSHFSKTNFKPEERCRINRKEIRRFLFEMMHFGQKWFEKNFASSDEALVKHVEKKIIEHQLQLKKKILIDNTSVSAHSRKTYVDIAKAMHKSIGVVFMNVSPAVCLERNKKSEDPAPEIVISTLAAQLVLPTTQEGFNEVMVIKE